MATETPIISNLPIPPGEYLEEVLEGLGMSKSELATRMDRPLPKLSAIFKGEKAITPDTALQLERATGVPAHIWTGLENEYRLSQARQRAEAREAECAREVPLVTKFCYSELAKLGLVEKLTRPVEKVIELQKLFGVMSLSSVLEVPRYQVAHRHGVETRSGRSPEAVAAWLRMGELRAYKTECSPFNEAELINAIGELREMTCQSPVVFGGALQKRLAGAGVALIICEHFPKTKAHGATFFLTPEKAVLMLTVRCMWADIFWFTLFHELGHILLHGQELILEDSVANEMEREADEFARDTLIADTEWKKFAAANRFDLLSIKRFAQQVGIAPGIVVGRLQHYNNISQAFGNDLRIQYTLK